MNLTTRVCLLVTISLLPFSAVASPKSDYMIHCMGCHTLSGGGMPPEVPAFDKTLGDIVSLPAGRAYLIQVPGASQSPLNDEQLAAVLSWLLRRYVGDNLPADFRDMSTEEVTRFRSITLANPKIVRDQLLRQIHRSRAINP